jgi:DNA-binding NarL/FixJ family response regulator
MMTWALTTTHIHHPAKERTMIRILLVDDVPTVLNGLRLRLGLEEDLKVVGEALDGESALALAQELQPDVVVMDVGMPRVDGIAAIERLREVLPGVRVVVLSIHDDADTRERAFQAGASAYVEKRVVSNRLVEAIRAAVLGATSTT